MNRIILYFLIVFPILIIRCTPRITGPVFIECSSKTTNSFCLSSGVSRITRFKGGGEILISWKGRRYRGEFFTLLDSTGNFFCEVLSRAGGMVVFRIESVNNYTSIDFMDQHYTKLRSDTIRDIPLIGRAGITVNDVMGIFCARLYGLEILKTKPDYSEPEAGLYSWEREGPDLVGYFDESDQGMRLERMKVMGDHWHLEYSEFRNTIPVKQEFRSSENNYILVEYDKDLEFDRRKD